MWIVVSAYGSERLFACESCDSTDEGAFDLGWNKRWSEGTKYSAKKVAPPTPPLIVIAKGGQNPPPLRISGVKPAIVVTVVARM